MRRGADSPASFRPWVLRRCVSSSSFASSLMTSSAPPTLMPASSSCTSKRSTGTFSTFAKSATVTSAIRRLPYLLRLLLAVEPVRARRHDQLGRALRIDVDLAEVVDGLLREVLARHDAAARERERELSIHALEREQVFGRLGLVDDFLGHDRLSDQHVARPRPQLVHDLR